MEEWVLHVWYIEAVDHHEESGNEERSIGLVCELSAEQALIKSNAEIEKLKRSTIRIHSWVLNREKIETVFWGDDSSS